MARIRQIKPEFWSCTDLAALTPTARLLYVGLWAHMDIQGICEHNIKLIKRNVFPYDDQLTTKEIELLIQELISEEFLFPISEKGKEYLFCPTFSKHQKFHPKEQVRYELSKEAFHCDGKPISWNRQATYEQVASNLLTATKQVTSPIDNGELSMENEVPQSQPSAILEERFLLLYKLYPKKVGKRRGLAKCKAQIKTEEEYQELERAINRYIDFCQSGQVESKFIKHFDSFMAEWRDWVEPSAGTSNTFSKSLNNKKSVQVVEGI